jgi:carbamate kinase
MRVVVALGGNALIQRGQRPDVGVQRDNIRTAAVSIARLAEVHDVVVTHGNGPQIGLLALESSNDQSLSTPYPLDVLGAETDGMIGYLLEQELQNLLPGRQVVTVLTQTVVDATDPAFSRPSKPIGAVYDEVTARGLASERGWSVGPDGDHWRRLVPSPEPQDLVELPAIRLLADHDFLVICCGGGGIPATRSPDGILTGVEAVVDKDLVSALLATDLHADALLLLTDVDGVHAHWGTPQDELLRDVTPDRLRALGLHDGSMGPKVEAACRFVEQTGGRASIGRLADAVLLLAGSAGTQVLLGSGPPALSASGAPRAG